MHKKSNHQQKHILLYTQKSKTDHSDRYQTRQGREQTLREPLVLPLCYLPLALQFIFIKHSKNVFIIKVSDTVCSWKEIFFFFLTTKIFINFHIITWSPVLNLGSLLLFSTSKWIYVLDLTSIDFIFIHLWYVLFYLSTSSSNLSI